MRPEEVIIAPIITEKSNDGLNEGKYTFEVNKKATKIDIKNAVEKLFEVNPKATKIDIKNAVEKLFEVKVLKVNTMNVSGKQKRMGRYVGKTSDWKKAIVTIDTDPEQKTYLAKGGKETKISKKYKDSIDSFMGA